MDGIKQLSPNGTFMLCHWVSHVSYHRWSEMHGYGWLLVHSMQIDTGDIRTWMVHTYMHIYIYILIILYIYIIYIHVTSCYLDSISDLLKDRANGVLKSSPSPKLWLNRPGLPLTTWRMRPGTMPRLPDRVEVWRSRDGKSWENHGKSWEIMENHGLPCLIDVVSLRIPTPTVRVQPLTQRMRCGSAGVPH